MKFKKTILSCILLSLTTLGLANMVTNPSTLYFHNLSDSQAAYGILQFKSGTSDMTYTKIFNKGDSLYYKVPLSKTPILYNVEMKAIRYNGSTLNIYCSGDTLVTDTKNKGLINFYLTSKINRNGMRTFNCVSSNVS